MKMRTYRPTIMNVKHKLRFFFALCKNILSYAKYAYKNNADPDYDYVYLIELMKWKVERMAKDMEVNDYHDGVKRNVKQMRHLIFLINRYRNGGDEYLEAHYYNTPQYMHYRIWNSDENDEGMRHYMRSHEIEQDAYNRIFKHMERYLQGWWW